MTSGNPPTGVVDHATVQIALGPEALTGTLTVPAGASGVVLFAHGSGGSR